MSLHVYFGCNYPLSDCICLVSEVEELNAKYKELYDSINDLGKWWNDQVKDRVTALESLYDQFGERLNKLEYDKVMNK